MDCRRNGDLVVTIFSHLSSHPKSRPCPRDEAGIRRSISTTRILETSLIVL